MKKKILFVSATLEIGGVQNILSNLSMELQQKYDITILLNDTEKIKYPYGGRIISLGLKQQDNRSSLKYQMKVFLKRYKKLKELKRSGNFDYCISMLDSANVANILTGNKECKVVTTVYTNLSAEKYDKTYHYIVIPLVKRLYNKSDRIVVTSRGVQRDLVKKYGLSDERMTVIYDGVNIGELKEQLGQVDTAYGVADRVLITSLGRLNYAKAQWHLIRAMKKVIKEVDDALLLIMGTGELKSRLKKLVVECGLQKHVVICGYTPNPFYYIGESQAFVLSSIVEGYPTVLLEAMVCGIPCVCTDFASGGREILAPETDIDIRQKDCIEYARYGIITPVCDGKWRVGSEPLTKEEELLADAIIELLTKEEMQKMYRKKIKEYSDSFTIENCTREWEKVLEAL